MSSIPQIQANVCDAYTTFIKENYPKTYESGKLLFILSVYRWHLARFHLRKACNIEQLMALKTAVREAELLFRHLAETGYSKDAQHWVDLVSAIVLELTKEIDANERLYPELKSAFDRERAEYRKVAEEAWEAMTD